MPLITSSDKQDNHFAPQAQHQPMKQGDVESIVNDPEDTFGAVDHVRLV